jgi:hypothetical protein
MEVAGGSYFNTTPRMEDAISNERHGYENMFGSEAPIFTPSALFALDTNSHDDLNDILCGNFTSQLGSSGTMNIGSNASGAQGTSYSPYPDPLYTSGIQANQEPWGAEFANAVALSENVPEINREDMQYSEDQTRVDDIPSPTRTSQNGLKGELATKRAPDTMIDAAEPKPKKKRGPRKRKEKSAEEKKAKADKKLERNRLAASKCREKKKETGERTEKFHELERQNKFLKASLEQLRHERNEVITLLMQHKECGHASTDNCTESLLPRVAAEAPIQYNGSAMARTSSQSSQASAMSRSAAASQSSYHPGYSPGAQSWNPAQSSTQDGWQEHLEPAYHQSMSRQGSNQSHKVNSPEGTSTTSTSRRNSTFSTEHGTHCRSDSGLSSPGTPISQKEADGRP